MVDHGLMTESEKIKLENLEKDTDKQYHLYWVPMRWAQNAVRQEGTNIAKMTESSRMRV